MRPCPLAPLTRPAAAPSWGLRACRLSFWSPGRCGRVREWAVKLLEGSTVRKMGSGLCSLGASKSDTLSPSVPALGTRQKVAAVVRRHPVSKSAT